MDCVINGDLLDRLAATDRIHGDLGFELRAVGAALAYRWEILSGALSSLRGERWELNRKTRAPQREGGQLCW
jgi:hypothetical protein